MFGSLVSTEELASNIGNVKVLDGSWHMPNANRDPYEEYLAKHIKTAEFFPIDTIKDTSVDLPHMLPAPKVFAKAVGDLGISNDDQVVVYDTAGIFSACRVYWTFKAFGHNRVSVLNGGLPLWIKENRPTESGRVDVKPVDYKVKPLDTKLVRDYATVLANAKLAETKPEEQIQVLDARPKARFTGEAPEPRAGLSSGHMPNSISVPFNEVIDPTSGKLLDDEALRKLFASKNVDLTKPVITSCGSGITASILYLALERAGAKDIAVYDGSWTEYADKKDSLIVKSG
ncbi:Rhodanese-like domain-containing protein [Phycomyces nitens]|nr:Rhodanese-like domain-containing protein [Phycomyces nitens]